MHDSVVNQFGQVHEISNLFAIGGGNFKSLSSVNPTLIIAALTIRVAKLILDKIL